MVADGLLVRARVAAAAEHVRVAPRVLPDRSIGPDWLDHFGRQVDSDRRVHFVVASLRGADRAGA